MKRSRTAGLTLVEALVTVGLLAVIVQLAAVVFTSLGKVSDRHREGANSLVALVNFSKMRHEAVQAVSVQEPSGPNFGDTFRFQRMIPSSIRLPALLTAWDPQAPEHRVSVRYHLREGAVHREETLPSGTRQSEIVAEGVDSFLASRQPDNVLDFRFSFRVGAQLRPYRIRVSRVLP